MAVTQVPERKAREEARALPTMYDLPSEDPEEPGLPDDFHYYQPQLLRESFSSPKQATDQIYIGADINLYYDCAHPLWHKRPDWFLVIDAPKLYRQRELRLSYVVWDEPAVPYLVVELLSPGTEKEDLGEVVRRQGDEPPGKWEVYETLVKIPYYVLYDRYVNRLRVFRLTAGCYRALSLPTERLWLPEAGLGLGLWTGCFENIEGTWLRWYDAEDRWLPTAEENLRTERQRAEQADRYAAEERQCAEHERQRVRRLTERLKALGIDPENE